MKKDIILLLIPVLIILGTSAYTAPTYSSVNITLGGTYTAPTYSSVNITLGEGGAVAADPCDCPGVNNDWEIDLAEYCIITVACDLGTGKLNFTGTGNFTCDANINTTDLGDPGSGGIIYINDDCELMIS